MALIGDNIGYSMSPGIFRAILDQLSLKGSFDLLSVSPAQLPETVRRLKENNYCGFAVTIPHKVSLLEYLDNLDETAKQIGAVNSVAILGGRLVGYNTDCHGFTFGLNRASIRKIVEPVLVIGSGGGARAVIYALSEIFGVREGIVLARHSERLDHLKKYIKCSPLSMCIQFITNYEDIAYPLPTIVNCTPLGGANYPDLSPLSKRFDWSGVNLYCDLNYNENNLVVGLASTHGAEAVDGSAMLVAQAIRSFELWTGYSADFQLVYQAVFPGRHD